MSLDAPAAGLWAEVDGLAVPLGFAPLDDICAVAAYRRRAAAELVARAVRRAAEGAA